MGPVSSPATGGRPSSAIRWVRWALLVALVAVGAAALRLSAAPITAAAAAVGVPWENGGRETAVVMIEGAVLILSFLWLHPATQRDVRGMSAAGVIACLALSAAAGMWHYGWLAAIPVGVVPSAIYAWLVHVLSRELLGGARAVAADEVDQVEDVEQPTGAHRADEVDEVEQVPAGPSRWQRITGAPARWMAALDRWLDERAVAAVEDLDDDPDDGTGTEHRAPDTGAGAGGDTGDERDDTGDDEHDDRDDEQDERPDEITRRKVDDDALRAELAARLAAGEHLTVGGLLGEYVAGTGRMTRVLAEAVVEARTSA